MTLVDMDVDGFDDVVITRNDRGTIDGFIVYGGIKFNAD